MPEGILSGERMGDMELRTAASPRDVKHYTTERLREEFLIPSVFEKDPFLFYFRENYFLISIFLPFTIYRPLFVILDIRRPVMS